MAPKKNARESTPVAATAASPAALSSTTPVPQKATGAANWDVVLQNIYDYYMKEASQRTKLVDAFLVFLVAVGVLQFVYCVLAGNYPFNAFLSGFSATVGQFVLAVSLRIQTSESNKSDFPSVSPERAFADFVVCSLILHVFCINFIN